MLRRLLKALLLQTDHSITRCACYTCYTLLPSNAIYLNNIYKKYLHRLPKNLPEKLFIRLKFYISLHTIPHEGQSQTG